MNTTLEEIKEQIINAYMPVILDKNFTSDEKREFIRKAINENVHKALEEAAEEIEGMVFLSDYPHQSITIKKASEITLSIKDKY